MIIGSFQSKKQFLKAEYDIFYLTYIVQYLEVIVPHHCLLLVYAISSFLRVIVSNLAFKICL